MPNYVLYRDDIETIASDEQETHNKIIEVMTEGQNITREKYGKAVRISHAKAHGLLKGKLIVEKNLPLQLAQGLFAKSRTYDVIVRLATAPGEYTDDSKVSTARGMSIKVLDVEGAHLAPFENITTQDFVFDTGKEFITSGAKSFLQAFKPNAEIAPTLSDNIKGVVSNLARGTNDALNAVGINSEKLDFYGHKKNHPMDEEYYSQLAFRYGDYIAKFGVVPSSPGLLALKNHPFAADTSDALREATLAFFQYNPAEFEFKVQLNTDLETMDIEDGMAKWPEEESQYQTVARLVIPAQNSYDPAVDAYLENLSFSPAHSLVAHRPLGGVNRARLAVYTAMAALRRHENNMSADEPASLTSAVAA